MLTSSLVAAMLAGAPLEFSACRIGGEGAARLEAECAVFEQPENPAEPGGRQLQLRVARLAARTNDPAAEPLVFFAGGPGQSAIESFPPLAGAFREIRQQRPILLLDQRGTGESNPLHCPFDEAGDVGLAEEQEILEWTRNCLANLDGDPRFYTTDDAVRDLEALRQALGVERFMLYGVSYGTRMALEYMRRHPDAVAAAVLDGVAASGEPLGLEIASDAQRALDAVFERCAANGGCSEAFPELRQRFGRMQQELARAPVTLELRHPGSFKLQQVDISGEELASFVRMAVYARHSVALLPLQLSLAAGGDFTSIGASMMMMEEQLPESMAMGMHMSVACNEDVPFYPDNAGEESEGTFFGPMSVNFLATVCSEWPQREMPNDIKDPVAVDVPVLLLSGEFDPVTPPSNADQVQRSLSRSLHVVAPGQGHGVGWLGCVPGVMADFFADADPLQLDAACVQRLEAEPFFIDVNGPTP